MRLLIFTLLASAYIAGCSNPRVPPSPPTANPARVQYSTTMMVGIWQKGGHGFAAGWDDNFRFFSSGRFIFNFSQMDPAKRELRFLGLWQVLADTMDLVIEQREILFGGHFDSASAAAEVGSNYIGAERRMVVLSPPMIRHVRLNGVFVDSIESSQHRGSYDKVYTVTLDSVLYSKMRDDPNDYQ
jgi:hypothetical protein